MPSLPIHKAAAREFLEAYAALPDACVLGKAVCLAYCALHVVEAAAAAAGVDNPNHGAREDWLREHHPPLAKQYRPLRDAGYFARYRPDDLRMTAQRLEHELRRKRLKGLLAEASKLLGSDLEGEFATGDSA